MPDIVDAATRSRMMSGIRSKNTKIEVTIRKALFSRGFRYRIHSNKVFGKPDLVFPKYKAVIFVNGCFWHGHDCDLFKLPGTRREFWEAKIKRNQERDAEVLDHLHSDNWRCMMIWECALKGTGRLEFEQVIDEVVNWLTKFESSSEIRGTKT